MGRHQGRVRRTRLTRRAAFRLVDKLGNGLLLLALVGVPVVAAVNILGEAESRGGGERATRTALPDDVARMLETGQAGDIDLEAAANGDGVDASTRDRALGVLEQLPEARRQALYERFGNQLEARGISPEDIEKRLGD